MFVNTAVDCFLLVNYPLCMYRIALIKKGNGKFRKICVPNSQWKKTLRELLPTLETILDHYDTTRVNYAFQHLKNCALNAYQHIGYRYTLSLDLEDFFDSITPEHVKDLIPENIITECFIDGSPMQGLPTSPLIATIAFLKYDKKIINLMKRLDVDAIYTRYADDLIFSFNDKIYKGRIQYLVQQALLDSGFRINSQKTKLQDTQNGRRIITGIAVDDHGLHPTRRTKRKLRAAIHQNNLASQEGLKEWAKCKLPSIEKYELRMKTKHEALCEDIEDFFNAFDL